MYVMQNESYKRRQHRPPTLGNCTGKRREKEDQFGFSSQTEEYLGTNIIDITETDK